MKIIQDMPKVNRKPLRELLPGDVFYLAEQSNYPYMRVIAPNYGLRGLSFLDLTTFEVTTVTNTSPGCWYNVIPADATLTITKESK